MTPTKLFVLGFVANIAIVAVVTYLALHFGQIAWHQYEADRDTTCRVALSVQTTRRDSVVYAVDHGCSVLIPVKP